MTEDLELSVVIPLFNEEAVILTTMEHISKICQNMGINYEIIAVDDGSADDSLRKLKGARLLDRRIRVIRLARNSGHMSALMCGLRESRGNYTVTIDADLQDPPELIPEMFRIIREERNGLGLSFDVVQTTRELRSSDSLFKRRSAHFFYASIAKLTNLDILPHGADFRIVSRYCVDCLVNLPENRKVLRLLIPYLGFRTYELKFERQPRYAGQSKYDLKKMIALGIDSIISFSAKPIRWVSITGGLISMLCVVLSFLTFILWLTNNTVTGWTSLVLLILGLNALILAAVGLIGEYVGRLYELSQQRPIVYTEME